VGEGRFDVAFDLKTPTRCPGCGEDATGFKIRDVSMSLEGQDDLSWDFSTALTRVTMKADEIIMLPCECRVRR
jgi:hypothetical protein